MIMNESFGIDGYLYFLESKSKPLSDKGFYYKYQEAVTHKLNAQTNNQECNTTRDQRQEQERTGAFTSKNEETYGIHSISRSFIRKEGSATCSATN